MDASDSPSIAVNDGEPRVGSGDLFYKSRDFLAYIALGIAVLAFHGYITSAGTANVLLQTLPIWMLPGLILAFFAAGIAGDRHRTAEQRQRFADNLYFLGFIFTMSSLIATFLPQAWSQTGSIDAQGIYRAFGTALISTALGLILRVVVMQSAPSADESAVAMEEDLTRLTARVAAEARAIGDSLAEANSNLAETSAAQVQAVLGAIAPRLEALVTEFGKATQDSTALLRVQGEATRGEAEALRLKVKAQSTDLTEAARLLAAARAGVAGSLDGLAEPVAALSREVAEAGAAAAATTTRLRDDIARLAGTLAAVAANGDRLAGAIDTVGARTAAQGAALEKTLDTALGGLSATIDSGASRVTSALDRAEGVARTTTNDAQGFGTRIEAAMASFNDAVDRLARELDQVRAETAARPEPAARPAPLPYIPPAA